MDIVSKYFLQSFRISAHFNVTLKKLYRNDIVLETMRYLRGLGQSFSSVVSMHWAIPSHIWLLGIHLDPSHRNWSWLQPKKNTLYTCHYTPHTSLLYYRKVTKELLPHQWNGSKKKTLSLKNEILPLWNNPSVIKFTKSLTKLLLKFYWLIKITK